MLKDKLCSSVTRVLFGFWSLLLLGATTTHAQLNLGGGSEDGGVAWEQRSETRDGRIILTFEGRIDPGLHVFSAQPPEKSANLPTEIHFDEKKSRHVKLNPELKESGQLHEVYDEIFETDIRYYKERVTFVSELEVTGKKPLVAGELVYQVCDESGRCVLHREPFSYTP